MIVNLKQTPKNQRHLLRKWPEDWTKRTRVIHFCLDHPAATITKDRQMCYLKTCIVHQYVYDNCSECFGDGYYYDSYPSTVTRPCQSCDGVGFFLDTRKEYIL